jgi:predicted acylesterase/phospholipase RssA
VKPTADAIMSKETSKTNALAEEVLQEFVRVSKDRSVTDRERRGMRRDPEQQARLEKALRPFNLLQLVLRLKNDRAFSHARQILFFMRNSQVSEPELRRVYEEYASGNAGAADAAPPSEPQERGVWKKALEIAADPKRGLRLAQLHTLCTYKDSSLPARTRLESALRILCEADDLASTDDQETLGLAGAIHKRLWETDGQLPHLERSLHFYRRGYEAGIEKDYGYTAINAAFVLDLLAEQMLKQAGDSGLSDSEAEAHRRAGIPLRGEADRIREEIVHALRDLPEQEGRGWLRGAWWFVVTVAEAYFGLGFVDERYFKDAERWSGFAADLPGVPDWEFETTARQLMTQARLRADGQTSPEELWESEAFLLLRRFLKEKAVGLRAALAGKVGLALSGGGFRASLFHVGVLAKLAELDMLRNVEVISCVSAGSIIGALYYLELRELLQSTPDAEITRADYIALVRRVERNFLEAVQRNIRTRLGAEFWTNFKTVVFPNYTRTERAGELLDEMLYSRVGGRKPGRRPMLNELDILPRGEDEATFNPAESNWRRAAKVPLLVINATTLNTGHNWQFMTDWMGEPATSINPELDRNPRLRRVRYAQAPEAYREFPLARAVGASTCTLGLMEPVTLKGLYPGMSVRLVDGVFSNAQCITAALERDCNVLLVSDASGQMHARNDPGQGIFGATLRSSNIMFGHFRERQYEILEARRRSGLLRGLMFLHLKKGLDAQMLFADESDAAVMLDDARPQTTSELTRYGVLKEVQRRLSEIRTDLDAFSDAEAYALMMSGYLMTAHEFESCIKGYPRPPEIRPPSEIRPPWRFLAIEEIMKTVGNKQLALLLDAAHRQLFKFVELSPALRAVSAMFSGLAFALLPILLLGYLFYYRGGGGFRSAVWGGSPFFSAALAALLFFVTYLTVLVRTGRKTPSQIIVGIFMCTAGFLFARLTLHVLDPWYLARGRIGSLRAGAPGDEQAETGAETTRLGGLLHTVSPTRPIGYLSQKVDASGSVKSIVRLIDHARAVEAVAMLFEHRGYETTRYPREQKTNPLQLKLDLYARSHKSDGHRIFAVVRTRSEAADLDGWGAVSELDAAALMLSETGEGVREVEGLLVLIDVQPDKKLKELVEKAQDRGVWIVVVSYTGAEAESFANALPGDPALEEGARRLEMLIPSGAGDAAQVAGVAE